MTTSDMYYAGSKPTVIALHCSGGSGAMWRPLADKLADRFMLVAPDLIGCGAAAPWHGAHEFAATDEAKLTVGMIDASEAPVHLVGHSYGGGVALRVARERPGRIASLTLYEPSLISVLNTLGQEGKAALAEVKATAREVFATMHTGATLDGARLFANYWGGRGSFDAMPPDAQAAVARHLPKLALEYRAMAQERVSLRAFQRFNFPILLLQGEHSLQPALLVARQLHRAMKYSSLHTVYRAGHMGPLTHAAQVAAMMADHIVRVGSEEVFLPIAKRMAA